jgi:hypothetical protein
MPSLRTGSIATAAALLAGAAAIAVAQTSVSAAQPAPATGSGIAILQTNTDLPPGAWTNTPLEVRLPCAGTYELDADVRGRLNGNPPINVFITARLWNATSGAEVPGSERLVNQIIDFNPLNLVTGGNHTAPISELIRVTQSATIRLQAQLTNNNGAAGIAQVASDANGYTSLRYVWIGP